MPLRELLQLLFGEHWVRRAAEGLGIKEQSIYRKCKKEQLSRQQMTLLLAKVPECRREIHNEWQRAVVAASHLAFDWARSEKIGHIDRDLRHRLERLSAAEGWCAMLQQKRRLQVLDAE